VLTLIHQAAARLARPAVALLFAGLLPAWAHAAWPSQPITLVVGFPPGGSNDLIARIIAPRLGEELGVPVVVQNKPGANAAIGTAYTVNAKPDGYTITLGSTSVFSISPYTVPKLPYRPLTDLTAITTVAASTAVLAVNPGVPARTLDDLVALARTRPVTLASAGAGGISHLNIELLKAQTKANFMHVPYKGSSPATADVVGGQVDGIIMDYSALAGMIGQGRLHALVASKPVGAITQSDMVIAAWYAVMAPAATPRDIVDRLHGALLKVAADPGVRASLAKLDIDPMTQDSPEAAQAFIQADSERWSGVVKSAGLRFE